MQRLGQPEDVASVVDFLLSDKASYITGQLLQPNGGQVMW
jgi:NAD(P)-dependent dehydrogenase (short-subunit alcohol dehydrogenase family)